MLTKSQNQTPPDHIAAKAITLISQHEWWVETSGRSTLDISSRLNEAVRASNAREGLATVFVHHTSASLFINENADPDVRVDLERFFSRLVQDGDPIFTHRDEGDDDMSVHIRNVLTATSLSIPVRDGVLDLGTWQGVYLWEHRKAAHKRRVSLTLIT